MGKDLSQVRMIVLPFRSVMAFADVEQGQVYLAQSASSSLEEIIRHELAHVISGDPDHGKRFRDQLDSFGGIQPPETDVFRKLRRRLGIPYNIAANIGNISGTQSILLDYHLLQAYRKFSQRVLATEGHWEVINEGTSSAQGDQLSTRDQLIRLYPTPKGAFPVVVLYIPIVNHFRSPQARRLTYDLMEAEAKIIIGTARRKVAGMPTPDGGSINYDGAELVQEGYQIREKIIQTALQLGEPVGIWTWSWWLLTLISLVGQLIDMI